MKHYVFESSAIRLAGTGGAREFFEPIFASRNQELLLVAFCNNELRLLGLLGFPGSATEVELSVFGIMRSAICAKSSGIVIAHNHPSGDTSPSDADRAITRKLCLLADALDITVLDHLIFHEGRSNSFREMGLL